ncbi:cell division protein ZapE [Orrella sp. 11846]|uniref:cell division protein ZapE n=1 Tax=Orrella sp. 11846 TaxID=3409913 RepID=UPI003B59ED40
MNVTQSYELALQKNGFQADAAQKKAVERLQQFYDEWQAYQRARSNPLRRLLSRTEPPRGVYLWGGVGRGKSFLMDAFYDTVEDSRKARLHFHEFMRSVHRAMDKVKGRQDPLEEVAREIASKYQLICFDEFHVSDVADAMILHNLLFALFERGVAFIMTSNYEPSTLYPEGLHRDRILPAIQLIYERMDVLNVDSGVDYRRRSLEQVEAYHYPLDAGAQVAMETAFETFSESERLKPEIELEHRLIPAVARSENVIWFDFETLCEGPRSQNDYLELANQYQVVLLSDVPKMTARQSSAARRFTWLVDVLYDHRVKLIISADCEPEALYTEGPMSNEFHRTVSRLLEMQSLEYLESEARVAAEL